MFDRVKDGMYWDRAWKLVEGCTPVSEGCVHCWSARETHMRSRNPNQAIAKRNKGLTCMDTKGKRCFNGKIRLRPDNLSLPLRTRKPTVWAIWNDLFHEDVPLSFIAEAFCIMASTTLECSKRHEHEEECWTGDPHVFMVLTKRPERMKEVINNLPAWVGEYFSGNSALSVAMEVGEWPLLNVWLGVTAENQEQADKRIPILLQIPAAHRYVSIEPMLGPVDLVQAGAFVNEPYGEEGEPAYDEDAITSEIDWIICGGESGPGARPMHPDWARSLRDQCVTAGVPFFLKQMHVDGKLTKAPILDGKQHLEMPNA